jgi:fructokinase
LKSEIDIICVGEVLIDYIGNQIVTLENTTNFEAFVGGSPTNVALYSSKLGLNVSLVATCGNDDLGEFIIDKLTSNNVDISYLEKSENLPTSIIYVSRSIKTPDFKAHREADNYILEHQIPDTLLAKAKIYHTTCFALSKKPAQTTILNRAKKAAELGLQLSIDINYSDKIWSDRTEMQQVIAQYLQYNPLVKLSDDDCFRYFNCTKSDQEIFDYFHGLGANTICLTKGENGVKVSDRTEGILFANANKIENIKDSTGAGDAFWTGFLYSKLHHKSLEKCIEFAQKLAAIKLQNLGGLPDSIAILSESEN